MQKLVFRDLKGECQVSTKLYVGNLSFQATEQEVNELFAQAGEVASVKIITDRETGRSRGFAFVEMSSEEAASAALEQLDGKEAFGRNLKVSVAQDRERTGGGGGGGFRGNRSGGGPRGGGGFGGGRGGRDGGGRGDRGGNRFNRDE
ncbi:MAG: RNA-binding protein [Bacteriovoracaceae bacterium]|nr:RNA-binding protein [Bacteriovoracaceae bacterium]